MAKQMYRVMLAGPSLLYAPLYLAKIERLSYAYPWIKFDYPTRREVIGHEEGKYDPVYYKLLSPTQDHDVVLAVADPFRLRYPNATGPNSLTAVVVGGLIQRLCLWLVFDRTGFDMDRDNYKDHFNQIVVHRKEMTSYALMRGLLRDQSVSDDDAEKLLFRNARVGEEHLWARWRPRYKKLPFAYLTTDRNHAIERYSQHGFTTAAFFEHSNDQFKQVFYTGLVTSKRYWDSDIEREIVEEIVEGIMKAIKIIYEHPDWAAKCLFRDAQLRKLLPGEQNETLIADYLRALTGIEAYVKDPGLKVARQIFENGFAIHEKAQATDVPKGILGMAELCPLFTEVIVDGPASPLSRTSIYHVEPSEPGERPSSRLRTCTGVILASLVSLFSLTGNASSIGSSIVKPLVVALSGIALYCMLPALIELLEGTSEKFFRNSLILILCIAAMMNLTYTLADWPTTVGALSNWAVFLFAFYKFARRYWVSHVSPRQRFFALWVSALLFINRVWHCAKERRKKQNLSEPLPMRRLWRFLPPES